MAYKLVDYVINNDIGDAIAKLVLIALARFANESGACFPSIATLCRVTHLSHATVCRKLGWLEEQGYIHRNTRAGVSTRYILLVSQRDTPVSHRDTKQSISSKKHPIPEDWSASADLRASINEVLEREIDHDHEEAKFRDYYLADGKQLAKWEPAYRNWCRRIRPSSIEGGTRNAQASATKRHEQGSSFFARAARSLSNTKH